MERTEDEDGVRRACDPEAALADLDVGRGACQRRDGGGDGADGAGCRNVGGGEDVCAVGVQAAGQHRSVGEVSKQGTGDGDCGVGVEVRGWCSELGADARLGGRACEVVINSDEIKV